MDSGTRGGGGHLQEYWHVEENNRFHRKEKHGRRESIAQLRRAMDIIEIYSDFKRARMI